MPRHLPTLLTLAALLAGCAPSPTTVSMQQSRALRIGDGGFLAFDLLATDGTEPIPCDDGGLEVTVSVTAEGGDGHFTELAPQSWVISCDDGRTGDLALVFDNSGSESGFLGWLRAAGRRMSDEIIRRGGRVSVTRVSTNAEVVQPLTATSSQVHDALDGMFISNGWTSLWDGIRLGNETLGGETAASDSRPAIEDFCFAQRPLGVVTFTDGVDNNSADEKASVYDDGRYPGDSIDTTLDDLSDLRIGDATTPVYAVGLGRAVDHEGLSQLAIHTGARYRPIDTQEQIPEVFSVLQRYFDATHEVCVELPDLECGELIVNVDWSWTPPDGGPAVTGTAQDAVTYVCPDEGDVEGRVATMLLTLGDPGISPELASQLALQAVEWVSPRLRPHVAIVLDDDHNGEDVTDHELVQWLLADVDTLTVTFLDEPADGLLPGDVDGFDVVWFANPGYPMDDESTFNVLLEHVARGGGLVLQGDDLTWSSGQRFDMSPLTGMHHVDNGTTACGQTIDNRRGTTYTVTFDETEHSITRGLAATSFLYGNDIDGSTVASPWAEVVATAVPTDDPSCPERPVIIGYDP